MKKIHIDASTSYDVLIGAGLLDDAGAIITQLGDVRNAVIVSDDNVYPLYGDRLKQQLEANAVNVNTFVTAHGEQSKSLAVYGELLEFLCKCHMTRSDILIALGGGVVGDLTGFAAATYQRGIRFVQVPTSLLAAVDSSVGGKTAVNLSGAKNQVGCFYQPSVVICDIDTLSTLPENEYRAGCAEVIKYGMIGDAEFFNALKAKQVSEWYEGVIAACVSMKRDVVMRDEFDRGDRMLLNFGHTLGHCVEKLSHYEVEHGYGVAMGMAVITKAAEQMGICESGVYDELVKVLKDYGLPASIEYNVEDMYQAALADKKNAAGVMRIIVPQRIGKCAIKTIPVETLRDWMAAGGI